MQRLATIRIAAIVLTVLIMLSGGSHRASAATEPTKATVAVDLVGVRDFNLMNGTCTMDLYLVLRCDQEPCKPDFELMNGGSDSLDQQTDDPLRKVYRIQATLKQHTDLHDFPFDRHALQLTMEEKNLTTKDLVYAVSSASKMEEEAEPTGWILETKLDAKATEHYYDIFDAAYPRYTFTVWVRRPLIDAILKGLFPAFVLMVSGLLSLIMTTDKAGERLGVTTSALVGTVLFHLTLTGSVPPVPYLTWADRFMIVNYLALGLTLVVTGALVWLQGEHREELAQRFDPLFRVLIPSLWVTGQIINVMFLGRLHIHAGWVAIPLLLQAAQIVYLITRYRSQQIGSSMDHAA